MSWTDERVELLRKLWTEGLSASQIAAELAHGITRNAVIGKVHRLGLSGRAKAPAAAPARPRMAKPVSAAPAPRPMAPVRPIAPMIRGATALAYDPSPTPVEAEDVRPVTEVVIPISERVTIMELREGMCRWPIGDPTSAEFGFCGGRSTVGDPYCTYHADIAYQPAHDRRRERERRLLRAG